MNWEAMGAIGEIVGAVGVIATLAYLAVQIRQNTASLKASTIQTVLEASASLHDLCASDPDLGRIFIAGSEDQSSLAEEEQVRFHFLMMAFLRRLENIYHQGLSDQVSDSEWSGVRYSAINVLARPGANDWWTTNKSRFNSNFVNWASNEMSKNDA